MSQKNSFAALEQDTSAVEAKMNQTKKKKISKPKKYEYVPDHIEFSITVDTEDKKKPIKPKKTNNTKPKPVQEIKPVETKKPEKIIEDAKPKKTKPLLEEKQVEEKFNAVYEKMKKISLDGYVPGHVAYFVTKITSEASIVKKQKMTNELNSIVQWYEQNHGVIKDHVLAFEITQKVYKFAIEREKKMDNEK